MVRIKKWGTGGNSPLECICGCACACLCSCSKGPLAKDQAQLSWGLVDQITDQVLGAISQAPRPTGF